MMNYEYRDEITKAVEKKLEDFPERRFHIFDLSNEIMRDYGAEYQEVLDSDKFWEVAGKYDRFIDPGMDAIYYQDGYDSAHYLVTLREGTHEVDEYVSTLTYYQREALYLGESNYRITHDAALELDYGTLWLIEEVNHGNSGGGPAIE